ncbi:sensor histidine kinase [Streptomyces flaveolus]|uniref:sensor histidine kinase n=1 Tax=Streptomyces flaveolus TaxID=67297 RepID=UPI0036F6586C
MERGQLRVYLGAAPGVGKTYAMLAEGQRRAGRGTDVVVGYVETYGRPRTEALLEGLEIVPRKTMDYRGATFTELDADAVIARHPQVALIDELAHTNVPGSANDKRWQDVERVLEAGITVISTVNVQHLESLNDVVRQITGVPQRETIPDEVVRRAEQVELVDITPEALRRRMAHGNIYPPEKVDAALTHYFRAGNLTALRELALLWLADKVDDQLERYRADHGIAGTWEARERVVVALTGGPEGDTLVRRASRIAERTRGADLLAVHVTSSDGLASAATPANLARQRTLVESLGGTYHQAMGNDIPTALLDFARGVNATQLVLGASRRGLVGQLFSRGVGVTTVARSGTIDVHLVTHEEIGRGRRAATREGLTRRRRLAGFFLAATILPLLTLALAALRGHLSMPSDILAYFIAVIGVALVGGLYPALAAALAGFLLLNYYFTPPVHTFAVADADHLSALAAFILAAAAVSTVVDIAARRTHDAARATDDAEALSTLAGSVLRGERALDTLLERLRQTYGLTSVTLLERRPGTFLTPDRQRDPGRWQIAASVGDEPCATPDEGDADIPVGDGLSLVLRGHPLPAAARRVLEAYAAQAAVALRQQRLEEQAEKARPIAEADRARTAILHAISHDLRTPLAAAKDAVNRLAEPDGTRTEADRAALTTTATGSLARLDHLLGNLLDVNRLQAGTLGTAPQPLTVQDIVLRALESLGPSDHHVDIRIPDGIPELLADPALVERILVNLVTNALHHSPTGERVLLTAGSHADRVEIRVIDHGLGAHPPHHEQTLRPFQRLGAEDSHAGAELGLTLARGLAQEMGGTLAPEETPGGGVTMVLSLPTAAPSASQERETPA